MKLMYFFIFNISQFISQERSKHRKCIKLLNFFNQFPLSNIEVFNLICNGNESESFVIAFISSLKIQLKYAIYNILISIRRVFLGSENHKYRQKDTEYIFSLAHVLEPQ